jgi:hypothetical protein
VKWKKQVASSGQEGEMKETSYIACSEQEGEMGETSYTQSRVSSEELQIKANQISATASYFQQHSNHHHFPTTQTQCKSFTRRPPS